MAKHKSYTCVVKSDVRLYSLIELEALEKFMCGSSVTTGNETKYYFERQAVRDGFMGEMAASGITVLSSKLEILDDEA